MTPVRAADVSVILAQHGIDPDADAATLMAALEARGWTVTVEATGIGRTQRYTAHATRVHENRRPDSFPMVRTSIRTTRATLRAALAFALAKALEKEQEA
ncbi:MAG: hypothetical protein M3Q71_10675 [Chloroflexota bacterium]|nr:hypothetical protein [Chloroflexota bacterium]MDP9471112.1 hypothetical protein [Chloroflexota bacterium]